MFTSTSSFSLYPASSTLYVWRHMYILMKLQFLKVLFCTDVSTSIYFIIGFTMMIHSQLHRVEFVKLILMKQVATVIFRPLSMFLFCLWTWFTFNDLWPAANRLQSIRRITAYSLWSPAHVPSGLFTQGYKKMLTRPEAISPSLVKMSSPPMR